jgi:hypothetical protein
MPRIAINCAAVEHVDHSVRCAATVNPIMIPPMLTLATAIEIMTSASVNADANLRPTDLIARRIFIYRWAARRYCGCNTTNTSKESAIPAPHSKRIVP